VEALRVTLSCIRTESNTNLGAGLVEARQSLFRDPGQTQCVLLLTDGFATSGIMDADALLELAEPLTESSVLHVIGYGEGHQADLLSRMATVGGGSYHMVCNKEDVAVVIGDVVGGLVSCAFQQVTLTLPVCEIKTRYQVLHSDTSVEIRIGDLMEHGEAIVLARLPIGSSFHVDALNRVTGAVDTTWAMVYATEEPRLHAMGAAHWLRWEVVTIMEDVAAHVETFGLMRSLSLFALENRVAECLTAIQDTRLLCSDYEAALWDLLTHELTICQTMMAGGASTVHLRQHGATLSLMRGMSSRMDSVNSVGSVNSVNGYLPPLSLSRAFSNATQRSWSDNMSQQVGTQSVCSLEEETTPLSPGGGYGGASASILPPLSLMRANGNARTIFPPSAASAANAASAMQETQDMF
jgi:von Willebrand factor type A domain